MKMKKFAAMMLAGVLATTTMGMGVSASDDDYDFYLSIPIEISILFGNSEHPFPERKNMPFRSRVQPFI